MKNKNIFRLTLTNRETGQTIERDYYKSFIENETVPIKAEVKDMFETLIKEQDKF